MLGGMDIEEAYIARTSTRSAVAVGATAQELAAWQQLAPWPVSGDELARLTRG